MKPLVIFFLILVTAYTMQGPRKNETLILSVSDSLYKYGGFVKYMEGSAERRLP